MSSVPDCLLGTIPYDPRIGHADRQGLAIVDLGHSELLIPFQDLQNHLQSYCTAKESVL